MPRINPIVDSGKARIELQGGVARVSRGSQRDQKCGYLSMIWNHFNSLITRMPMAVLLAGCSLCY